MHNNVTSSNHAENEILIGNEKDELTYIRYCLKLLNQNNFKFIKIKGMGSAIEKAKSVAHKIFEQGPPMNVKE